MAIIAILMILSATAFLTIRDQVIVDSSAEEFLTAVREAQNRAISVTPDSDGNTTKVWAAFSDADNFNLLSLFGLPTEEPEYLTTFIEKQNLNPQSTKITINATNSGSSEVLTETYIAYASPFGKPYLLKNNSCANAGNTICQWKKSSKPNEEWEVISSDVVVGGTDYIRVEFSRNEHVAAVIINSNGDARIE
jgi:type II secretory pathway pseudopilin PulG